MPNVLDMIKQHAAMGSMGLMRLNTIKLGIRFETDHPGARFTRKQPKCSTILRKEFGLSGKPERLRVLFDEALVTSGVFAAVSAGVMQPLGDVSQACTGDNPNVDGTYNSCGNTACPRHTSP